MSIECYFLEPTDRVSLTLRRYVSHADNPLISPCPGRMNYHDARTAIGDALATKDASGSWRGPGDKDAPPHDDPRWPTHCACGYAFRDTDEWQFNSNLIYTRTDNGAEHTLSDAPPGAMWYADWMLHEGSNYGRGPDNHSLMVRCPDGWDWCVDGPCSNCTMPDDKVHKCWVRHGAVPNITVDKNGFTCAAGAGSIQTPTWHGFLRDGVLTT